MDGPHILHLYITTKILIMGLNRCKIWQYSSFEIFKKKRKYL